MLIPPPSTPWSVKDQHLADWTVVVNNERAFQVNSTALASNSSYFYKAFAAQQARAEAQGGSMSRVTRLEYSDLDAVKEVLNYITKVASARDTSQPGDQDAELVKLLSPDRLKSRLKSAKFFGVPRLLDAIVSGARRCLTLDGCWDVMSAAADPECSFGLLEQIALDYAKRHFFEAAERPQFTRCVGYQQMRELLRSDYLNAPNEFQLFEIVCHWVEADENARLRHFPDLLSLIRLGRLAESDLDKISVHHLARKTFADTSPVLSWTTIATTSRSHYLAMRASNPPIIRELLLPRLPHQVIFLCGGWEGSLQDPTIAPSTSVQLFDPMGEAWIRHDTYLPAMDTRHAYSACVELDKIVYLIGGFVQPKSDEEAPTEQQGPTARVSAYSLRQRVWRERAAMHEQRNFVSACRCQGRLYAMGGHNGQHRLATAESYDPLANRWQPLACMHSVRSDACATSLNGLVYICGGFSGSRFLATSEQYNPSVDQWTVLAPMSTGRSGLSASAFHNYIYVMGGNNGIQRLASVERYDPETNAWTETAPMPTQRSNFCSAVLYDRLYAIGGWSDETRATVRSVETCKLDGVWDSSTRLDIPNSACSCCTISDCYLIEPLLSAGRNFHSDRLQAGR